jgi:hypothetical protein
VLNDPLDNPILARRVTPLDQDKDLVVTSNKMLLKFGQLDLQVMQVLSISLLGQPFVRRISGVSFWHALHSIKVLGCDRMTTCFQFGIGERDRKPRLKITQPRPSRVMITSCSPCQ